MNSRTRLVIIAAVALVAAALIYTQKPPHMASRGSGAAMVAVTVPALTPEEKAGEAAYNTYCAACHGQNAAGQDGVAPPFINPIYRPAHHSDQAFLLAAQNGARAHHWKFGDMPPVDGVTAEDVRKIVTYVRALQRANGVE